MVSVFLSSLLVQNVVLSKFLGISMFVDTKPNEKVAFRTGLIVLLVVLLSSILNYFIYNILDMYNLIYLRTLIFVFVIVIIELLVCYIIKKLFKDVYNSLGLYFPLITSNCMVFGVSLLNIGSSFSGMLVYSLGASSGFILITYIFASMRDRLQYNVPKYFRGLPIALVVVAIMALIFSRYISL